MPSKVELAEGWKVLLSKQVGDLQPEVRQQRLDKGSLEVIDAIQKIKQHKDVVINLYKHNIADATVRIDRGTDRYDVHIWYMGIPWASFYFENNAYMSVSEFYGDIKRSLGELYDEHNTPKKPKEDGVEWLC